MLIVIAKLMFSVKELHAVDVHRCSEFVTRKVAQKAFDSDNKKYAWTDRDHDGIACESLPLN